jgi:hypothetical protein
MRIELPYPVPELFPNRTKGKSWKTTYQPRKEARELSKVLTLDVKNKMNEEETSDIPQPFDDIEVSIIAIPPDKRHRDIDGLIAAFKPYQDGIFEALGLDDADISKLHVTQYHYGEFECLGGTIFYMLNTIQEEECQEI